MYIHMKINILHIWFINFPFAQRVTESGHRDCKAKVAFFVFEYPNPRQKNPGDGSVWQEDKLSTEAWKDLSGLAIEVSRANPGSNLKDYNLRQEDLDAMKFQSRMKCWPNTFTAAGVKCRIEDEHSDSPRPRVRPGPGLRARPAGGSPFVWPPQLLGDGQPASGREAASPLLSLSSACPAGCWHPPLPRQGGRRPVGEQDADPAVGFKL